MVGWRGHVLRACPILSVHEVDWWMSSVSCVPGHELWTVFLRSPPSAKAGYACERKKCLGLGVGWTGLLLTKMRRNGCRNAHKRARMSKKCARVQEAYVVIAIFAVLEQVWAVRMACAKMRKGGPKFARSAHFRKGSSQLWWLWCGAGWVAEFDHGSLRAGKVDLFLFDLCKRIHSKKNNY